VETVESIEAISSHVSHCDIIVDAILGTGLDRNVAGRYREVIELINRSGKTVISVDIPSGINGNNGKVMGTAVRADYTVTFGLPKLGNILYPGFDYCGELYVTHISFPPEIYNDIKVTINDPPALPARDLAGHKGTFGQALFIAGAAGYYGAPYFAALSFLKAGGGYSRLACPESITPFIANKGSEIVFIPQKETADGSISRKNKDELLALANKLDFVVIGPGLSLSEETQQLTRELTEAIEKPILLDGDGITALCENLQIIKGRKAETVITPHLGEMSRITRLSVDQIQDSPIDILQRTASELGSVIVLKGAHSLIGYPDETVFINMSGNAGMGTAGSGDVLTGTVAAMYTLGLNLGDAVRKGVFIHGFSGDLAAEELGEDGITAQNILDYLPLAVAFDRDGIEQKLQDRYAGVKVVL
jgi:NAD(P)H-hydrate epimerase